MTLDKELAMGYYALFCGRAVLLLFIVERVREMQKFYFCVSERVKTTKGLIPFILNSSSDGRPQSLQGESTWTIICSRSP